VPEFASLIDGLDGDRWLMYSNIDTWEASIDIHIVTNLTLARAERFKARWEEAVRFISVASLPCQRICM
jgi:hypothetical protein